MEYLLVRVRHPNSPLVLWFKLIVNSSFQLYSLPPYLMLVSNQYAMLSSCTMKRWNFPPNLSIYPCLIKLHYLLKSMISEYVLIKKKLFPQFVTNYNLIWVQVSEIVMRCQEQQEQWSVVTVSKYHNASAKSLLIV